MARSHEEASTSQAGRKRGTPWETPTVSSLVATMFVEELSSFGQVLTVIRLEVSDDTAVLSTSPESSLLLDFASSSRLW